MRAHARDGVDTTTTTRIWPLLSGDIAEVGTLVPCWIGGGYFLCHIGGFIDVVGEVMLYGVLR